MVTENREWGVVEDGKLRKDKAALEEVIYWQRVISSDPELQELADSPRGISGKRAVNKLFAAADKLSLRNIVSKIVG